MRDKSKKILGGVLTATLLGATFAMSSCGGELYKRKGLDGYTTPATAAVSNGGFAVEYGEYVYFVNGMEDYSASNKFGEVTKGALMRMKKSDLNGDLSAADYNKAETVVPMLFAAQNFDSGIYIYGDYVYYATPTTDKNMNGEVEYTWIDFKRAKLDGSETMKNYYFRLSDNAAKYRFVQVDGVDENKDGEKDVFCLYEEDGKLKSYNTATDATTVLVSGAKSSFYYDTTDLTNPNVYYTMSVAPDSESPNPPPAASYDQLYCVNAAAKVESVNAAEAKYTVKDGKTYAFNKSYMEQKNADAKANGTDAPYDFNDYTTYPYVNLGKLVLDGIGSSNDKTQFNETKDGACATFGGYNYTITGNQNGGVYFTRKEVVTTGVTTDTALYYLADVSGEWNAIAGNTGSALETVAPDTTNTGSAVFYKDAGKHKYLYVSGNSLYRAEQPDAANNVETVRLTADASGATLWKLDGDYLYYFSGTNGNNVSRINYTGDKEKYDNLLGLGEAEYKPVTISFVDRNTSWYKPEIFGDILLYSGAQTFGAGSTSYEYIYVAKLTDIEAQNEKYEAFSTDLDEFTDSSDLKAIVKYYFRTGEKTLFEAVKDLYDEDKYVKPFEEFIGKDGFVTESRFIRLIGAVSEEDQEAMDKDWADSLRSETQTDETSGLPVWAIVLIVFGGLLVAAAALVPVFVISAKKKAQAKAAEETVNAYKRKRIDTTDDKTIDVYADEEKAENAEEETAGEQTTEEQTAEAEVSAETEITSESEEITEETAEVKTEGASAETAEEKKDE